MPNPSSGQQYELRAGDQQATIVEVGAGIRVYRVGERDVLQPYPLDAMCDGAHGAPLIPWPNRLGDGRPPHRQEPPRPPPAGTRLRVTLTDAAA